MPAAAAGDQPGDQPRGGGRHPGKQHADRTTTGHAWLSCGEKAQLYMRALQHYTDLADIKRVIVNTHAIDPQQLVEYFGSLSADWALDCLKVGPGHMA